jgi:hypothetical protein
LLICDFLCHMAFCCHFFFLIEIWVKYALFCDLNLKDKIYFVFYSFQSLCCQLVFIYLFCRPLSTCYYYNREWSSKKYERRSWSRNDGRGNLRSNVGYRGLPWTFAIPARHNIEQMSCKSFFLFSFFFFF